MNRRGTICRDGNIVRVALPFLFHEEIMDQKAHHDLLEMEG